MEAVGAEEEETTAALGQGSNIKPQIPQDLRLCGRRHPRLSVVVVVVVVVVVRMASGDQG